MASSADAFALRTRPNSAMTTRRTALFAAKDAPTPVMEVPLSEIEVEQLRRVGQRHQDVQQDLPGEG